MEIKIYSVLAQVWMSLKKTQLKINESCSHWLRYFRTKCCVFFVKKYKVDLFEKEDRFGGHSHTIDIKLNEDTNKIHADIGFIVFNKKIIQI